MKKLMMAAVLAAVLMVGFTSCSAWKERCYKVDVTYQIGEDTFTTTQYAWGSVAQEATQATMTSIVTSLLGAKIVKTDCNAVENYKTKQDCDALNSKN